jgi:hypothetical protein
MSEVGSKLIAAMVEKYGPIPDSFVFGDGIDWASPLEETNLYVELPFWLMVAPGEIDVEWSGARFEVQITRPWMEIFVEEVTDSRVSCLHQGPRDPMWQPAPELAAELEELEGALMSRPCKTVLRLTTRAHASAFRTIDPEKEPPRARAEQQAYWASLCEAHIPVINELIQRYRLLTYDYFAYEVSAWDVPVWYLKYSNSGHRAVLLRYKEWDSKPTTLQDGDADGDPATAQTFEFATSPALHAARSADATPGEFDLLDARNLMERGDYTGAVRRTVTAIEAALEWALRSELRKKYSAVETDARLVASQSDFPGRLRQWRKLANPQISDREFERFEETRELRHQIVHRGRRLTHEDRGRAQRAVDTGRWLYNKIEQKPDRMRIRERDGVLKAAGRVALALRFPANIAAAGITLGPLAIDPTSPDEPPA